MQKQKNMFNVRIIEVEWKIVFYIFLLDIFIWFDRVWQALQEYEYQKNSDAVSNRKFGGNQKD